MKERGAGWRFRLEIPADLETVGIARRAIHSFLEEHKLKARDLREVGLAVTEAVNNAIENGSLAPQASIEIELRLDAAHLWLAVRGPSDPSGRTQLRRALARVGADEMEGERGRGLFLLKSMMDEIGVRALSGGRTEFWMSKKR